MPTPGERKIKDGVLGEFDGTTWRMIAEPGTRKTKNGITAEWDGNTWREVTADNAVDASKINTGIGRLGPLAVAAAGAALPAIERAGLEVATNPSTGKYAKPIASKAVDLT